MTEEGKKIQEENIKKHYTELKEERIVTSKDVALKWIIEISKNYDGAGTIGEHRALVDELVAYALLGLEAID